jgi:predicted transcriptional regulator
MKAIIELGRKGNIFAIAREQLAAGEAQDFRLSFESARMLFAELTPARIDLIDTLRRVGPCSVYALAKAGPSESRRWRDGAFPKSAYMGAYMNA